MEPQTENNEAHNSEDIEEIIGKQFPFYLRYGIPIIFLIFLFLLSLMWVIKYPDTISSTIITNQVNAAKPVVVRSTGKLIKLLVKENDNVDQGQMLGWIESVASHNQVINLEKKIDLASQFLDQKKYDSLKIVEWNKFDSLGELQQSFQNYIKVFTEYKSFIMDGYYVKKTEMLEKEKLNLSMIYNSLVKQKDLINRDLELAEEEYNINKKLFEDAVIPSAKLKEIEAKLVSKKLPVEQIQARIIENSNEQYSIDKEILDISKVVEEQKSTFYQYSYTLRSEVDKWKHKFLLISPQKGRVTFNSFVEANQYLVEETEVFHVLPEKVSYYGEIYISQENFGKIKIGQAAVVMFIGYPYQEYGTIKGKVTFVSEMPKDEKFLIKVSLPNPLITSQGKKLKYKLGMLGTAELITSDTRIIEKLIYKFQPVSN